MTNNFDKHREILLRILKDIYTDPTIASHLGFKGGTAAYLFYGLPRNSVDLDFDLLDITKLDFVHQKIQEIIGSYGKIVQSHKKRNNLLSVLSYQSGRHQIKIDISLRNFGSLYEIKTILGISMKVMVQADMFAHKLMAMYERMGKTSRDIYDVQFFAQSGWQINSDIVELRAGKSFTETVTDCISKLEQLDNKHMLDGLGDLLSDSRKDWVRSKLKSETLFSLQLLADK
jgi:predicted nucleotidyltransferase component of viral defense system